MVMRDYKTSVLVTTPPLARHLLTVMARMNLSAAELSLKQALLVASPLPGAVRREIEAGFQVRLATAYGITEVMGPGLAFSCEAHKVAALLRRPFLSGDHRPGHRGAAPPGSPANWLSPPSAPWPSPSVSGAATGPRSYKNPAPAAAPWRAWGKSPGAPIPSSPWAASRSTRTRSAP